MAVTSSEIGTQLNQADPTDVVHTGSGTLAGRYLRMFWHPVFRADDLPAGHAVPVRIMSEDFTLYRGESGTPHAIAFRCAHRGTQLSTGWVEGDTLRCFYHGWVYDGQGHCTEQPAEPQPFCERIRIRSYPTQEYLGIIFAYFGEGEPPSLPRYAVGETATLREVETFIWNFNYWNSLDNKQDYAHLPFVHQRGGASLKRRRTNTWNGLDISALGILTVNETDWGYASRLDYPSGVIKTEHILMPNGYLHKSRPGNPRPEDPESGWRDTIRWTVPVDDEHCMDVSVYLADATEEQAQRYQEKRREVVARLSQVPVHDLVQAVLEGRMTTEELAEHDMHGGSLQDGVARWGQGAIADRTDEHLGRTDASLMLYRTLWRRELRALAEGRPLKQWRCPEELRATWEQK